MKYLLISVLITLAACGSGSDKPGSTGKDSIVSVPGNDTVVETNSVGDNKFNADTGRIADSGDTDAVYNHTGTDVLFVGEFATWHHSGGDSFDGLYDSTEALFRLCSNNKFEHVVASEISYDQYATCDTTRNKRVMLLEKDSTGRLNPVGVSLNIVGDHAYTTGKRTRVIKLSPSAIGRINATKVIKYQDLHPDTGDEDTPPCSIQSSQGNIKIEETKTMQVNQPKSKVAEQENIKATQPVNNILHKAAATKIQK